VTKKAFEGKKPLGTRQSGRDHSNSENINLATSAGGGLFCPQEKSGKKTSQWSWNHLAACQSAGLRTAANVREKKTSEKKKVRSISGKQDGKEKPEGSTYKAQATDSPLKSAEERSVKRKKKIHLRSAREGE